MQSSRERTWILNTWHLRYKISPAIKDFWFPKARLEFQCGNACNVPTSWNGRTNNAGYLPVDIVSSRIDSSQRSNVSPYVLNEETLCHLFFSNFEKDKFIPEEKKMAQRLIYPRYSNFNNIQYFKASHFVRTFTFYYRHSRFYCLSNEFCTILVSSIRNTPNVYNNSNTCLVIWPVFFIFNNYFNLFFRIWLK